MTKKDVLEIIRKCKETINQDIVNKCKNCEHWSQVSPEGHCSIRERFGFKRGDCPTVWGEKEIEHVLKDEALKRMGLRR